LKRESRLLIAVQALQALATDRKTDDMLKKLAYDAIQAIQ
jgi:hypothetical protein